MIRLAFIVIWVLGMALSSASAKDTSHFSPAGNLTLKNLESEGNGFLFNTTTDGYLVLDQLSSARDQACGLLVDIEFSQPMFRAGIFDIFWRGEQQGFHRHRSAFVIINRSWSEQRNRYLIPLCKLYSYSGNLNRPLLQNPIEALRLDYPSNKDLSLKFHQIEIINAVALEKLIKNPGDTIILEPYERLGGASFTSLDVVFPKIFFAFEEGLKRFWQDKAFLIFWLILIVGLKLLILRSILAQANPE